MGRRVAVVQEQFFMLNTAENSLKKVTVSGRILKAKEKSAGAGKVPEDFYSGYHQAKT